MISDDQWTHLFFFFNALFSDAQTTPFFVANMMIVQSQNDGDLGSKQWDVMKTRGSPWEKAIYYLSINHII